MVGFNPRPAGAGGLGQTRSPQHRIDAHIQECHVQCPALASSKHDPERPRCKNTNQDFANGIGPPQAVVRDPSTSSGQAGRYRIDQGKCVKCDACREQAPYAIAVVDAFGP